MQSLNPNFETMYEEVTTFRGVVKVLVRNNHRYVHLDNRIHVGLLRFIFS